MSWNNIGPIVVLEPGQSVGWQYFYPSGHDGGVQIAGPNVFPAPGDLGTLVASEQGKKINGINNVFYIGAITNISKTEHGTHNLQGGGVS